MLVGKFQPTVDAKNRIFMPAKLREDLGDTFIVAKDLREKCLKAYSLEGWEEYIAPLKQQNRKLVEKIMRFLHTSLVQVTPDSQGRITLPQELLDYAGITRDTFVVGCYSCVEIWDAALFTAMDNDTDREEMVAELEKLGL